MNVTPTQYIAKELFQQPEMLLKYKGNKDGALGIAIKNIVYQAGKYDVFVDIFGSSGAASAAVAKNKDADYVYNEKNISSFNIQKNIRYDIQHVNSENYNAMKCHYLLTQIADILLQLYEKGSPGLREAKKTIKNISSGLLKSFGKTLTPEDILFIETHGYVKAVV